MQSVGRMKPINIRWKSVEKITQKFTVSKHQGIVVKGDIAVTSIGVPFFKISGKGRDIFVRNFRVENDA